MNRDAYELYQQLRPLLQDLERQRLSLRRRVFAAGAFLSVVFVLILWRVMVAATFQDVWLGLMVGVALAAVASQFWKTAWQRYRSAFKAHVISRSLSLFGRDLYYDPEGYVDELSFSASRLFDFEIARFSGEDLVSGRRHGVAFRVSETQAERDENIDKRNPQPSYATFFRGLFFTADYSKPFLGETFILPANLLAKANRSMWQGRGATVRLEDPDFNRFFEVYTDDQVTARYLLTTKMMARLSDFRRKHKAAVYASLIDGTLNVAIAASKNLFEPPLHKTLLDLNLYADYLSDLALIMDIAEDLDLSTDDPKGLDAFEGKKAKK